MLYITIMTGLIALYFLIFIEIVDELQEGELFDFDNVITNYIQVPFDDQMTEFVTQLTFLGSVTWIVAVISVTSLFLVLLNRRPYAVYLILTSSCGGVINWGLKYIFQRERPDIAPLLSVSGYSFPSGHSMGSVILYGSLAIICMRLIQNKWITGLIWFMAFLVSFMIGLSRIYLGVHFPSDVVAGFVAGAAWLSISALVLRYLEYKMPKRYIRQ